jgi:hypothetical protein
VLNLEGRKLDTIADIFVPKHTKHF